MGQNANRHPRLDLAQFVREALEGSDELQDQDISRLVNLAVSRRAKKSEKITKLIRELHRE